MTLIVARALPGQLRMVGDTRITDRAAVLRGAFVGALRHVILGPDLCIAFAGDFERGQQGLQKVAALYKKGEPYEEILDVAYTVHADGRSTDFLLGRRSGETAELTRITGGQVERGVDFAWIGDEKAFEIYQRARQKVPRDPDGVPSLLKAFRGPLEEPGAAGVDAPCIAITTIQAAFKYAPIGVLDPASRRAGAGLWTSGEGAYGYTVLAPNAIGIGAIGVWFEGRVGALFYPVRRADPLVYRNVSLDDFKRVLELDFGIGTEEIRFD